MPQKTENAQSQRARWEGGRVSLIQKYSIPLLKAAWNHKSYAYVDTLVDLITPSIVNMTAIVVVMVVLNALAALTGIYHTSAYFFWWLAAGFCALFHLFLGLFIAKADKALYIALISVPRYLLWKIGLYFHIFKSERQNEWIRTTRETEQSSNSHKTL
jgi:hypothetical protein